MRCCAGPGRGVLLLLVCAAAAGGVWSRAQDSTAAAAGKQEAVPAWQQAIRERRQQLVESNGPGTDAALRTELLQMRDKDQEARGLRDGEPANKGQLVMAPNLADVDAALTAQLKAIVQAKGWPTIALVGLEASGAAALLLNHSADHAWQRELLPQLTALADAGKIDGSELAGVIDKELISEGKPQRYGTQFKFVDGAMAMYAVEDPGGLDSLRARTLLPPMSVYREQMMQIYHLQVSPKVISPAAQ